MFRKSFILIAILLFSLFLMAEVSAIDSSDWQTAKVGYEEFKIPPQFKNSYTADFGIYLFDKSLMDNDYQDYGDDKSNDFFSIRYVSVNLFSLHGYFENKYSAPKLVNVSGHEAMHFSYYDYSIVSNHSILWFSAEKNFITWNGMVRKLIQQLKK